MSKQLVAYCSIEVEEDLIDRVNLWNEMLIVCFRELKPKIIPVILQY